VSGISNKVGNSKTHLFLFFRLVPELQIYGLAKFEDVVGVNWRRAVLTERGAAVFRRIDERMARTKIPATERKLFEDLRIKLIS
jgi:hypothetical protein